MKQRVNIAKQAIIAETDRLAGEAYKQMKTM
jgi:hypothetical protein